MKKKNIKIILPPDPPPRKIFEIGDKVSTKEGNGVVIDYIGLSAKFNPNANDGIDRKRIFYDVHITDTKEIHSFTGSQMEKVL
jgi:hypothetical protein